MVPTTYDFGPKLMKEIARICIRNNESLHITSRPTLSCLDKIEQVELLTNSKFVGEEATLEQIPSGIDILNILNENKKDYFEAMMLDGSQPGIAERFELYLGEWQLYYDCINRDFSVKNMFFLLDTL